MPTDASGAAALAPTLAPASSSLFADLVGPIVPGLFGVDELSLAILLALAFLAALLILCLPATGDFFRHLVMLLFFFASAFGVVTAQNAITFYVTWEVASLFAWGIGQLAGEVEAAGEGVLPFQAAGALGSFAMLLGLALLGLQRHTLGFEPTPEGEGASASLGPLPFLFLLALTLKTYGLLSESWNLRPRRRFTLAGAALAGAGVLAIGMYPYLRLFGPLLGGAAGWREPTFWAAAVLSVVLALAVLGEADYRRALSDGAFSQFFLLVAVLTVGTPAAVLGTILGAIVDAFAFTGLFICLGAAEQATAQVLLRGVGGLAQRLPLSAALFVACSLSVVGSPPLGGFVVGRLIGMAAETSRNLPLLWMAVAGLTLLYLARLFVTLFLGEPRGPVQPERWEAILVASGGVVGALVLLGAFSTELLALLGPVARALPG